MKSDQALVAVLCALALAGCSRTVMPAVTTQPIEATHSAGSSIAAPATAAPPSASPTLLLGPLLDGIPTTVDGATVYVGAEAERAIKRSTTDEPFLVGGWFHEGRPTVFCPAYLYGTRWGCNAWIALYPDATATGARTIYPPDPPNLTDTDMYGATRPVVFRVHTHDPACSSDVADCAMLPVEEAVIWLGPSGPLT